MQRIRSTAGPATTFIFVTGLMLVAALAGCRTPTIGGTTPLTYDAIYGKDTADFNGQVPQVVRWHPDGEHYIERRRGALMNVDPATGAATPTYDHAALADALAAHDAFDKKQSRHFSRHPTLLSDDYGAAVIDHDDHLYHYGFATNTLRRLTDEQQSREALSLSPNADRVAFVVASDLYVLEIASCRQTRLTRDGSATLLNGQLDWVYQEEIYGRGNWQAYWWSPDGTKLAFLQLDTADVPVYPLVDHLHPYPQVTELRYPKAGEPNPEARLGIVALDGGPTIWADLSAYSMHDILIVRVSWSPDGWVFCSVQDRESRWLELNEVNPQTGALRLVLRETSPAWVPNYGDPEWLADDTFLWFSARDGYKHLYHYTRGGHLIARVSQGPWEARDLLGVDADGGWVYIAGTQDSPIEHHVYRTPLGGGDSERLTPAGYTHRAMFDPALTRFITTFSNVTTPKRVQLRSADGTLLRVLGEARPDGLGEYRLCRPEVLRVPTPAGYELNAMLFRPPIMVPGQRYPVMVFTYAGPHGPSVHNGWNPRGDLFKHLLAEEGYLVWCVDPHSASGEGAVSAWQAYQRLGETELADIEASLAWLADYAPVDRDRIGLFGYSYGGFMTSYALTHSTMFRIGIAGAPVTDWRLYDSVYTERYMRTPEKNPAGYDASSVVKAAENLHGRLLILHGQVDDNVHIQNTQQLIDRLEKAGKLFDLMIYPRSRHGLRDYYEHYRRLRYEFIKQHL